MPVRKTWPEPWVYFWSRLIGPWLIPIFTLLNPGPNGSFYLVVQFVRTSLCRFPQPAHHNSGQWSPASADSNFMPGRVAAIFALCRNTGVLAKRHGALVRPDLRYVRRRRATRRCQVKII